MQLGDTCPVKYISSLNRLCCVITFLCPRLKQASSEPQNIICKYVSIQADLLGLLASGSCSSCKKAHKRIRRAKQWPGQGSGSLRSPSEVCTIKMHPACFSSVLASHFAITSRGSTASLFLPQHTYVFLRQRDNCSSSLPF